VFVSDRKDIILWTNDILDMKQNLKRLEFLHVMWSLGFVSPCKIWYIALSKNCRFIKPLLQQDLMEPSISGIRIVSRGWRLVRTEIGDALCKEIKGSRDIEFAQVIYYYFWDKGRFYNISFCVLYLKGYWCVSCSPKYSRQ